MGSLFLMQSNNTVLTLLVSLTVSIFWTTVLLGGVIIIINCWLAYFSHFIFLNNSLNFILYFLLFIFLSHIIILIPLGLHNPPHLCHHLPKFCDCFDFVYKNEWKGWCVFTGGVRRLGGGDHNLGTNQKVSSWKGRKDHPIGKHLRSTSVVLR